MIRLGLTGTVGAGKSAVGRLFEEWGALRVDTDDVAREVTRPGRPALGEIRDRWGEEVVDADGRLDREALRRVALADPDARRELESVLHPRILRRVEERLEEGAREGREVAVVEVPLLFEAGLEDGFDAVIAVDAPREVRWRRVRRERGLSREEFDALDGAQWPGARKREAADASIVNDGSRRELARKAREAWAAVTGRKPE